MSEFHSFAILKWQKSDDRTFYLLAGERHQHFSLSHCYIHARVVHYPLMLFHTQ